MFCWGTDKALFIGLEQAEENGGFLHSHGVKGIGIPVHDASAVHFVPRM